MGGWEFSNSPKKDEGKTEKNILPTSYPEFLRKLFICRRTSTTSIFHKFYLN